jgi:Fe-S-cluster containining protein
MTSAKLIAAYKALDAIYAELPKINCKGDCHTTCGPIVVTPLEELRLRSTSRTVHKDGISCGILDRDNRCKAHAKRPIICRLFGIVSDPRMQCPYGCEPERLITPEEADGFMRCVMAVSDALGLQQQDILLP